MRVSLCESVCDSVRVTECVMLCVCDVCICQGRDNSNMYVKAVRVGLVSTKCNLSFL